MKKTLLALAVLAAASSVSAATVYDKDGTSFTVGGRVQSVFYNGANELAGNKDSTLVNSSRFSVEGRTQLTDNIAALAFSEWNFADGNDSATGNNIDAREQYVGVDFGDYGVLVAGKTYDTVKNVIEVTDIFEDFGTVGQLGCDDRRTGTVRYTYDNYGFFGGVSFQSAADSVEVGGVNDQDDGLMNVETGFSAAVGYTTPTVGFGPISVKAGYSFLKGQNDYDGAVYHGLSLVDDMKEFAVSASWGSLDEGVYLAALYDQRKFSYMDGNYTKYRGMEFVGGYTFESGVGLYTGYLSRCDENDADKTYERKVPVYVNYAVNENFNVWTEAQFDADSTDEEYDDSVLFSVGARYTF